MINIKSKFFETLCNIFYLMVIFASLGFVIFRFLEANSKSFLNDVAMFAVKMSFPQFKRNKNQYDSRAEVANNLEEKDYSEDEEDIKKTEDLKSKDFCCRIFEAQFGKSGIKCGNIYVKNRTGREIDFENYLSKTPKICIKNKKKPVVLIYHTHTSERYMDRDDGSFPRDFSPRTQDNSQNVVAIGDEIAKVLKRRGIEVIHDTTVHDYPNYNGAYTRSSRTVRECLKKNPGIQIAIDIHRDSMGSNKTGKIKPTFKTKDNKKAAQIMFISGCGIDKSMQFPNWDKNLTLSLNVQSICEKYFPGFTRELLIKNSRYNQNITQGSMLIEIGSDMNTIEESKLSAQMLGESLYLFLKRYLK